jgi:hypothetical protein
MDYDDESVFIWLEADIIIRQKTAGGVPSTIFVALSLDRRAFRLRANRTSSKM